MRRARLALLCALACALLVAPGAGAYHGYNPAALKRISKQVFGARWYVAWCVTRYESTFGATAGYDNGGQYGPWQSEESAHPWVDGPREETDWLYAARVAYRISDDGTDWSPWTTAYHCV